MTYNPNNPNGSATSANSAPVVIASDQAALPLPTGAATSANQTSGNSSLTSIQTDVAPLVASAAGGYVRQDSNGTIAKETGGNLATIATNTTGVATSANQTMANSSLSSITTNTAASATSANQTNGTQQAKITNGTNIADVAANDTGYNGMPVNNSSKTYAFTTSSSGVQTLLANTDCRGYSWIEVVYTSVGSGLALTGQFSATSGGTYLNVNSWGSSPSSPLTSALGVVTGNVYRAAIQGNFFQLAISALTSGTLTGTVTLRTVAPPNGTQNVNGSVSATVAGTVQATTGTITTSASSVTSAALNGNGAFGEVTIHGTYAGVSFGITCSDDSGTTFYNAPIWDTNNMRWLASGATITPGSNVSNTYVVPIHANVTEVKVLASAYTSGTANIKIGTSSTGINPGSTMSQIMDAAGNARGANVYAENGLAVSNTASATGGYSYAHIAAGQATSVVKASAGTLHTITFNGAATSTNTTNVYDNASGSGTVIAIPAATAVTTPITVIYDIAFANGLTIITATANGADMTVAFK